MFQNGPTFGASLGTMLITKTTGYGGARMAQDKGEIAEMEMATTRNR